jgi:hypothetical protein
MPTCRLVSERRGIIAWWKIADGGAARLAVLIAILVRRSMEPTGRGAASNIGQPIPTVGVLATTTSEGQGPTSLPARSDSARPAAAFRRILLRRDWRRLAELNLHLTNRTDVRTMPLPERLRFLYPILWLPLWVWRHASKRHVRQRG